MSDSLANEALCIAAQYIAYRKRLGRASALQREEAWKLQSACWAAGSEYVVRWTCARCEGTFFSWIGGADTYEQRDELHCIDCAS